MIERALPTDLEDLLVLMRRYYAEDDLPFDARTARAAMAGLLETPEYGAVWVLRDGAVTVGYLALCVGYSLELGGRDAFVDEVYVEPEYRDKGWGTRMIEAALETARASGVQAVHLTVERANRRAAQLYQRLGFEARNGTLMSLRLEPTADSVGRKPLADARGSGGG
jgi:ribosomal protein S18 acetylase RimI-like enzyme